MNVLKKILLIGVVLVFLVITEKSNADVSCGIYATGFSAQGELLRVQIRSSAYSSILNERNGTGETLEACVVKLDPYGLGQSVCSKKYLTKPKASAPRKNMANGTIYVYEGTSAWRNNGIRHVEPIDCVNFPSN